RTSGERTEGRARAGRRNRSHPAKAGLAEGQSVNSGETRLERSDRPGQTVREAQPARVEGLWEEGFSRENLYRALQRVGGWKGARGVEGMTVAELGPWLKAHWVGAGAALDGGTYKPQPVRRVTIPKPGGGKRELGVPTVLDRLIQQALAQALTPIFDPHFSERSYGYRPSRSAQQAVRMARGYVTAGHGSGAGSVLGPVRVPVH